jgi:glycosyltransferase involved in cell wall biosynthesis
LRIAISADPFIPVPPENYGGIERIIGFLAEGLLARGHQVMLAAHEASTVNVPLIPYPPVKDGQSAFIQNARAIKRLHDWQPDVIHSFSRLAYLLPLLMRKVPKIMSYQREPTLSQIKKALLVSKKGSLTFTGCSDYISNQIKSLGTSQTVYNGVDINKYTFNDRVTADAPLIFLGRIEPIKGTHHAIDTALKTGRKLIIAGNIPNEHMDYYERKIKPHLSGNIQYVGAVNDAQKNELLGKSLAMLMPVDWNEPFGIVMCEAMACGTPVIGFRRGAVPEVIKHNINGFICNTTPEMIKVIDRLGDIDRGKVRRNCEERFSAEVIIDNYIDIYKKVTI